MKARLSLGRLAGIAVYVHWTFALLVLWIIFSGVRGGSGAVDILWTLLFVFSIFGCVVLHELGHALAARRFGIATHDITLLPIGGVARLDSMPEKPSEELIVAVAGPAVNVFIAALALPFVRALPDATEVEAMSSINGGNFMLMFMTVNITLVLFNLLPAFPMDGGRVLRALLSMRMPRAKATRMAATVGQFCAAGFAILGFMGNPMLVLIAVFIYLGAQSEAAYTETQSALAGHRVRDVLLRHFGTVNADDTVAAAVQALLDGQSRTFLVLEGAAPVGILTRDAIILALSKAGQGSLVRDVMDPDLLILDPEMPLDEAFKLMQKQRKDLMPVLERGELVGALDQENVAEFVMVMSAGGHVA